MRFLSSTVVLCLSVCLGSTLGAQQKQVPVSTDFNFWIGEWTVYQNGTEKVVGHSKITSIVKGYGIQEHYTSTAKYEGVSLNKYNQIDKQWEQYYIDNSGLTLHLKGNLVDGKMVLGNSQLMDGEMIQNRISWTPLEDGTVQQLWEQKSPQQTEWQIAFDGIYKRKE